MYEREFTEKVAKQDSTLYRQYLKPPTRAGGTATRGLPQPPPLMSASCAPNLAPEECKRAVGNHKSPIRRFYTHNHLYLFMIFTILDLFTASSSGLQHLHIGIPIHSYIHKHIIKNKS